MPINTLPKVSAPSRIHCQTAPHTLAAARLYTGLLTEAGAAELDHLCAGTWVSHVNQRDYVGGWGVLPLRCLTRHAQSHPILQGFAHEGEGEWQDLPALVASPHLTQLLRQIQCPVKSVRLMRLEPGAQIKPHSDPGLALEYGEARLHLPLRTDPRVVFRVGGQQVPMARGELWYMNADLEHSVVNASPNDRIHLVVDAVVNEWLQGAIGGV